jgi:murein L,D-transpeptidase YcbB/YkuD
MRHGDRGTVVAVLKQRLSTTGDLTEPPSLLSDLFDAALHQAVRHFQRRHGLVVDGLVGPATRAALQVPNEF